MSSSKLSKQQKRKRWGEKGTSCPDNWVREVEAVSSSEPALAPLCSNLIEFSKLDNGHNEQSYIKNLLQALQVRVDKSTNSS